jgi:HK97 family phage portal protein
MSTYPGFRAARAMVGWIKKSFPLAGFGTGVGPRRGVNVNAWSLRDWQHVLRGDLIGDLSVEQLTRSSAVVACAGLIADTLASAPLGVVQRIPSGGLRQVNESNANAALLTLSYDDRAASLFGCLTMGNGWLWLEPDGTLCALDSNRTYAYVAPDGSIWIKQGGDPYIAYAAVAQLRFRSQPGYILAHNPCLLAADSVKADLGIAKMAGAMALNAQSPGIIMNYPGQLSDQSVEQIRKSWMQINAGDQQGGVAVLEEGMTLTQLKAPSATDAQMVGALEWSAADICRLYAVPPTLLGLLKDSNKATSVEENRAFYARCLKPWAARISDVLGRLLLSDAERAAGLCIETDLSELALGQGAERANYLRSLVLTGIITRNEARNNLGFPDAPNADELLVPLNTGPADQLGVANAGTQAAN